MKGFEEGISRKLLFTPEECNVNRTMMRPISALQRSAMSIEHDSSAHQLQRIKLNKE